MNGMAAAGHLPLMDPVADLKLNQLEVVDAARERQTLLQAKKIMPAVCNLHMQHTSACFAARPLPIGSPICMIPDCI